MPEKDTQTVDIPAVIERYAKWNLPTHDERWEARRNSTTEELSEFYEGLLPLLKDILAECDRYPLGELPETHRGLFNIAMAFAEVAPHIELYKGSPKVPNSFDEWKFVASRGRNEAWSDYA